jgi:hypothetical protein
MPSGAAPISAYPGNAVEFACTKCERRGCGRSAAWLFENWFRGMVLGLLASLPITGDTLAQKEPGFENGESLFDTCAGPGGPWRDAFCLGYILGIADIMVKSGALVDGFGACFPSDVTQGQVRDAVVTWLRANPDFRQYGATGLVAKALSEAFPCR